MVTDYIGLEVIGELLGCNPIKLTALNSRKIKSNISRYISKYNFVELGSYYHDFDKGCTGVVALAESHIAFHTWPEKNYVSLNVFVCNYSKNNDRDTLNLFNDICSIFNPTEIKKQVLNRSYN